MEKKINYGEQFIDKKDSISLVNASRQKLITIGPKVKLFENINLDKWSSLAILKRGTSTALFRI